MFGVIKHSACRGENTSLPNPLFGGVIFYHLKVCDMSNTLVPRIVGLVDADLNCVYAASIKDGVTTVKHLIIPAEGKIPTGTFSYVEMSSTGYFIKPVTLTDSLVKNFKDVKTKAESKPTHWAINWFRADYTRWLIIQHFNKPDLAKMFIKDRRKENYSQPTTNFITTVTISKLLAAHVSYAYSIDCQEGDCVDKIESLLDVYIKEFKLLEKHGKSFRRMVINQFDQFTINDAINSATPRTKTIGVDTFI